MRFLTPFRSVVILIALVACANTPHAQPHSGIGADIAELWQEPADLFERDLFNGPGGAELSPPANGTYEFVAFKTTGTNPGYDVKMRRAGCGASSWASKRNRRSPHRGSSGRWASRNPRATS
jgi:hypothetical protein